MLLGAERLRASEDALAVAEFMEKHGYFGINKKRRTMFKFKYPLHTAVKYKDTYMIRLLLRLRADPTLKSSSGETPKGSCGKAFQRE